MFNIILKLNNNTRKKLQNYFFVEKKSPKSVVLWPREKIQVFEKKFFEKKILQVYLCEYNLQNGAQIFFFLINRSRDIYVSVILRLPENVLHDKITNKTWSTKNQEISLHHFGDNYPTNHLVKFLQDRIKPWRVGALRVCTGYNF